MKKFAVTIAMLLSAPTYAGLNGTDLSLQVLYQLSPSSPPIFTSFERSVTVGSAIEYSGVSSLFNPGSGAPSGSGLVDVAIDAGNDYIEIDFDNAGSNHFSPAFENTYIFRFDHAAAVSITGAAIDSSVTTLGLEPTDVRFEGNKLFINVEGVTFNPSSFARVNLQVEGGPTLPVPEPSPYAMLLAGALLMGFIGLKRGRRDLLPGV